MNCKAIPLPITPTQLTVLSNASASSERIFPRVGSIMFWSLACTDMEWLNNFFYLRKMIVLQFQLQDLSSMNRGHFIFHCLLLFASQGGALKGFLTINPSRQKPSCRSSVSICEHPAILAD